MASSQVQCSVSVSRIAYIRFRSNQHDENGKGPHYEFGGPLGAAFLPVVLVSTIYFLVIAANKDYVLTPSTLPLLPSRFPTNARELFPSLEAVLVCLGWFLFQVALERVLPGEKTPGTLLRDGKTRLMYNCNGHLAFWVSLLVVVHGYPQWDASGNFAGLGAFPLDWVFDHYVELASAAMLLSTALSCYLYVKSHTEGAMLALGGDTGNAAYDWFIGRELNPREGDFDWKQFCELRPGLIGWQVLNIACAYKQWKETGHVTVPMVLVNLFQGLYVWDALYSETAILTTMDITTDGFGFMLAFGDLAWVPFTYSLQARFLVHHSPAMPMAFWALVVACKVLGMVIFRGANGEKDQFRRDPTHPSVAHIEYLQTKRGTKLMTSGWWGRARKINYTGDWLMGLAWCLTTGFQTPVTYFYSIYFAVLLVHRALRDDEACTKKYGEEDWAKYKKRVRECF